RRLGAKVTVIEFLPHILPLTDGEIRDQLHRSLRKQGLEFHLEHKVTGAEKKDGRVVVKAAGKKGDVEFTGDRVLAAVGRRPYTAGLGLKEAGVAVEERGGRVQVNEDFQTSAAGVYAIGDLIQGPMLAHKAEE